MNGKSELKAPTKDTRPDIFKYHHYLAFMRDWLAYLKKTRDGFSLRSLAKDAGLSPAYLPFVLAGKRNLSSKALVRLAPKLGLSAIENNYFTLLLSLAEASSLEAQMHAMERIRRFRTFQDSNPDEHRVFLYLTRWFHVAIREMAALRDFEADPSWVRDRLRGGLSTDEIKRALTFLKEKGFLEADKTGKVFPPKANIRCEGNVFGLALRQFHREMTNAMFGAIDDTPSHEHVVAGHTFALAREDFPKVREILENALKKIEGLEHGGPKANSVYHVSLVSAPLTRSQKIVRKP